MLSQPSSQTQPTLLEKAAKAGLARWKMESLTGLFALKALQKHQAETEKNIAAENRHVRKSVWGDDGTMSEPEDMHSQTILGDVTHPTPIVIQGQQSGGMGKVLAGAALGAAALGMPLAGVGGYLLSQHLQKPAAEVQQPADSEKVNLGLLRVEDLQGAE
jgi:hypothetical protein